MADSYQAIYDAVRSRISGGNISDAVQSAIHGMNLSHYADMASRAAQDAASEQARPCVVFRAVLQKSGVEGTPTTWSASYYDLIAYGATPSEAMWNFDIAWSKKT